MAEIYKRLSRHGHFDSHKAYQGYWARVTIDFRSVMRFTPPLTDDFNVKSSIDFDPESFPESERGEAASFEVELPVRPPNRVREDAGMDLPVQVEENGMVVERWVKPSKFRGKTKPGTPAPSRSNMSVPGMTSKFPADDLIEVGVKPRP
jgi:hypothetical protein